MTMELNPDQLKNPEELLNAWLEVRSKTLAVLESFADSQAPERFLKKPEDGSWSAAEIAEHLYKTQLLFATAIPLVLKGKLGENMSPPENPGYEEKKSAMLGPGKYKNPEAVTPEGNWTFEQARKNLDRAMERLRRNIKDRTLEELNGKGYEHPALGKVTLLEWIWALVLHEEMHGDILRTKKIES